MKSTLSDKKSDTHKHNTITTDTTNLSADNISAPNKGTNIIGGTISKHSTDVSNFGSSAIYFDGTNNGGIKLPQNTFRIEANENFTFEAWCYRIGAGNGTVFDTRASGNYIQVGDQAGRPYIWVSGGNFSAPSTEEFSFSGKGWFHYVLQRQNGQIQMLINGKLATVSDNTNELSPSGNYAWIGAYGTSSVAGEPWNGYLDELAFYKGVAKYNPVATGLGTATITPSYLPDPTGNHFTTSGLAITDQMLDSPENNFCTLNPLAGSEQALTDAVYSEGNLALDGTGSNWSAALGTIGISDNTGKWYWECKFTEISGSDRAWIGIASLDLPVGAVNWDAGTKYNFETGGLHISIDSNGGYIYTNYNGTVSSGTGATTWSAGDIISVLYDSDAREIKWFVNGDFNNNLAQVLSGIYPLNAGYTWLPFFVTSNNKLFMNFGQGDPDGENNFTDSNGRGGFRFEPPQGHLALCTANMKDADYAPIGPNSAAGTPDKHFDTLLYTGNAKDQRIGGLNFQPDLVWVKNRGNAYHHALYDSVRGVNKTIKSSDSTEEVAHTAQLMSFNSDGFTVGDNSDSGNYANLSANTYVAWCWKAGNGTTINNDGTIQSTVSVNRDAGFSIVSYMGNATEGATVGHGLSEAPEIIFVKNRDSAENWAVYALDGQSTLFLNLTNAESTSDYTFDSTNTTSTVFQLGSGDLTNHNNENNIAYCWHSVEGYSKFGSFEGNSNNDGPFIYLGFKPAFVMTKCIDSQADSNNYNDWGIHDNTRDTYNNRRLDTLLRANSNRAEGARYGGSGNNADRIDFLSNGFKMRSTEYETNQALTHIYMAFAEMPFKYANAG